MDQRVNGSCFWKGEMGWEVEFRSVVTRSGFELETFGLKVIRLFYCVRANGREFY
ncbi:unnamed protein product [Linum tenue]|uniref:Uncharacterized protein n=1 Tax=Linum tenue TaxID=586396 RepID=A0AAV0QQS4_9ROSI|nr:unnamed protein product [Linum tenue]